MIRSEPGFIPWTALQRWAEHHGLSDSDLELLDLCVQGMDAEFRTWWAETNKVQNG